VSPLCHPIQTYHAMVDFADEAIGNFTTAIRAKKMWDDLVIVFSADNGTRTDTLAATAASYNRMQPGLNSAMLRGRWPSVSEWLSGGKQLATEGRQ
jgi:arylsulfatase A-like enzyme